MSEHARWSLTLLQGHHPRQGSSQYAQSIILGSVVLRSLFVAIDMTPVEQAVNGLVENVRAMVDDQVYMKMREKTHRNSTSDCLPS